MIRLLLLTFIATCFQGCVSSHPIDERRSLAEHLAQIAGMTSKVIHTPHFELQGYVRIANTTHRANTPAVVYIEGDGHAWDGQIPSADPTPTNPLALRLASKDRSDTVLYLARPCQYTETACDVKYWTSDRMAPEVIEAYAHALNQLQQIYSIRQFRLVGFSGGGGIAVLLAAKLQQQDHNAVIDLRTVAGNIDHKRWTQSLNLIPLTGSLNPADSASGLADLPQIHFIGKDDLVVPSEVYRSYQAQMNDKSCTKALIEPASHVRGWSELWKDLQTLKPTCHHNG